MCVVSNIGDDWMKRYENEWWKPIVQPPNTTLPLPQVTQEDLEKLATKEDIKALKSELESLKKLLKAAKIYDEETGQPECEVEEKVGIIKKLAEALGVDMKDVFGD